MQKNIMILGSGRSGTSMLAGLFANSGYFMGENLYPPRFSNPKGFFESPQINGVNESILEHLIARGNTSECFQSRNRSLKEGHRWLCMLDQIVYTPMEQIRSLIQRLLEHQPFCFKDPRFSYTLPYWEPDSDRMVFICIFRAPDITATSIVKECNEATYLDGIDFTYEEALMVWKLMYTNILTISKDKEHWQFVHYDQILNGQVIPMLQSFTGTEIDPTFPSKSLKRAVSSKQAIADQETTSIYERLCSLADYRGT